MIRLHVICFGTWFFFCLVCGGVLRGLSVMVGAFESGLVEPGVI